MTAGGAVPQIQQFNEVRRFILKQESFSVGDQPSVPIP